MTPIGRDRTMPTPAITRVKNNPPHNLVSTVSNPKPPENMTTDKIGNKISKKEATQPLYLRFGVKI